MKTRIPGDHLITNQLFSLANTWSRFEQLTQLSHISLDGLWRSKHLAIKQVYVFLSRSLMLLPYIDEAAQALGSYAAQSNPQL